MAQSSFALVPVLVATASWAYAPQVSGQPTPQAPMEVTGVGLEERPTPSSLEFEAWQPERVRKPNPGDVIDQPAPAGMPLEQVRQNARVAAAAGTAALLCPTGSSTCESHMGAFVALSALHRPETWFAWGGLVEGLSVAQTWHVEQASLELTHHILAGRLLAELHPLSGQRVDPYFGLGLGVGVIGSRATTSATASDGNTNTNPTARTVTTWTPFYAARLGLDVQLGEHLALGATADWSNFQALTGENCPWKVWGMCSSSGWGAFGADNAVWKVGAALSFAFGQEL